jgi:hypothetical protein
MRVEEDWTPCPDCDSDRVVPATYRNMAPWDSAFAQDGHMPESVLPASEVDAGEHTPDGEGAGWIVSALMRHYND